MLIPNKATTAAGLSRNKRDSLLKSDSPTLGKEPWLKNWSGYVFLPGRVRRKAKLACPRMTNYWLNTKRVISATRNLN